MSWHMTFQIVTNTKCEPNIILSFSVNFWGITYIHNVMISITKTKQFFIQFESFMTIFHYRNVRMQITPKVDELKGSWDDSICKLIPNLKYT